MAALAIPELLPLLTESGMLSKLASSGGLSRLSALRSGLGTTGFGGFAAPGASARSGSSGTIVKVVLLLLLLSSCAACLTGDVLWGASLRKDKCGVSDSRCWGPRVLYIVLASVGCIVATLVGLFIVRRMF